MTTATALARLKVKLDITGSTFDAILNEALADAMPRLAPWFFYDMAEDETVTLATDADKFTLPSAVSELHKIYIRTSTSDPWQAFDEWTQHGGVVYIRRTIGTTTYVKLLARRAYTFTDADLANLPVSAELPLLMFACAEFATTIVGNKRKFNIYQQSNGVRTLDEMTQLVEWYDRRAEKICEDAISSEG